MLWPDLCPSLCWYLCISGCLETPILINGEMEVQGCIMKDTVRAEQLLARQQLSVKLSMLFYFYFLIFFSTVYWVCMIPSRKGLNKELQKCSGQAPFLFLRKRKCRELLLTSVFLFFQSEISHVVATVQTVMTATMTLKQEGFFLG